MTAKKPPRGLTEKESAFIREYLVDKNGTQAAIRAGYSPRSAGRHSFDMLQRPLVKAGLAEALKQQAERTLIKADKVLLDIESIGDKALGMGEFSTALRSRELLAKHYKLLTDRLEVKDTTPRAERLRAARERLKARDE